MILPASPALECGRSLLGQPDYFLSHLIEFLNDEFVFYSLDSEWRFAFLSGSAKEVLGMEPHEWLGRPFMDSLSTDSCNLQTRNFRMSLSPLVDLIKGKCEFACNGSRPRKMDYRHARILHHQKPIGFAGIAYPTTTAEAKGEEGEERDAILARVNSLSAAERQVVEFVFDGRQNKFIAAELKVAVRTIESRRARAMSKLQVLTIADMVKLWARVQSL